MPTLWQKHPLPVSPVGGFVVWGRGPTGGSPVPVATPTPSARRLLEHLPQGLDHQLGLILLMDATSSKVDKSVRS